LITRLVPPLASVVDPWLHGAAPALTGRRVTPVADDAGDLGAADGGVRGDVAGEEQVAAAAALLDAVQAHGTCQRE
jgi:hypothetical protein